MEVTLQSSILMIGNLDRSIEFYTGVFGFPLIVRRDEVAVLLINEGERSQALTLRIALNRHPTHPGRGSIGVRALAFEVASIQELDQIRANLVDRHAFGGRHRTDLWETIIGIDPDQVELTVSTGLTGGPIQTANWCDLDEMVETITQ